MASDEEFSFLTLEEIEALTVFPEITQEGGDDTDGPRRGYVYLIEEVNQDGRAPKNFKVGQTVNPSKRFSDLQTGNPRKLNPRPEVVKNMDACENELLSALSYYRCTLGGGTEWFTAQPNQIRNLKATFTRIVRNYQ